MGKARHTPEEPIGKLSDAEIMLRRVDWIGLGLV